VSRWVEKTSELEVDVWVARIPYEETRTYVARVMSNLARYQWLRGGDTAVMELPLTLPSGIHSNDEDY
jgi:soluble lytic murein transglycosylase-like protein